MKSGDNQTKSMKQPMAACLPNELPIMGGIQHDRGITGVSPLPNLHNLQSIT